MPVLMKQHPQHAGEDSNSYMQRMKDEFYTSYMGAILLILLSMNILVAYLVKQEKRQADNQTK